MTPPSIERPAQLSSVHDADAASLLRRADEAMYRAKRAGRDRVVEAGSTPDSEG